MREEAGGYGYKKAKLEIVPVDSVDICLSLRVDFDRGVWVRALKVKIEIVLAKLIIDFQEVKS